MKELCLVNKNCIPCHGGVPSLGQDTILKLITELDSGWKLNELGRLFKQYKFNNFVESINFVNKVAEASEREGHHPNIAIMWDICRIEIWTHKINGLTENDFILAAKIDSIK